MRSRRWSRTSSCSPRRPSTHRPLAELSLAAGCHVVVEKPLALTLPDAVAIADASAQAGRIAMVAQNYRFRRQPRALHDLVAARALGRLLGIRISCRRDLRDAWISRRDWRGKMPYPYLLDMAIHHVDLVRMITGQEVAEVDARGWNVPDAPVQARSHRCGAAHARRRHADRLRGDVGRAALRDVVERRLGARSASAAVPPGRAASTMPCSAWCGSGGIASAAARVKLPSLRWVDRRGVLAELRRAVAAGEQPESSAADNVKSLATILAIARSTDERRPVRVEELLAA